jgi:hypothetical protein
LWPYLASGLRPFGLEVVELHDLGHDEALLEVGVDAAGGLGGLGAFLETKMSRLYK